MSKGLESQASTAQPGLAWWQYVEYLASEWQDRQSHVANKTTQKMRKTMNNLWQLVLDLFRTPEQRESATIQELRQHISDLETKLEQERKDFGGLTMLYYESERKRQKLVEGIADLRDIIRGKQQAPTDQTSIQCGGRGPLAAGRGRK